ncbi:hypothetical protein CONPUDRAFT_145743 [Coniophora puteana RWD-64-598 SS2]|uniref:F-box domain-containing protein n=1 Tax=Coniophora puteana (strain RWD-64-598) TaxID=741705 RepID=A0A5M3MHT0_CONPW|nr:uncharacterized protein CONPUDRAFT_145743 [Coniophora puteana RWD-64-598 SS2]EIW78566.1 hypothetical protein CONPUDRAFT_145743 [Coniophora puteana RWD-64-598 SS2]
MHCALLIAEISRTISEHQPSDRDRDRASLALTCKVMSEPVLDALWATLPCVAPLLFCLPPGAIVEKLNKKKTRATYTLRRALLPSDWDRLLLYTRRVVTFHHINGFGHTLNNIPGIPDGKRPTHLGVDGTVLCMLGTPPPGISVPEVFPRVRNVWWADAPSGSAPFLKVLLGPAVENVNIRADPAVGESEMDELAGVVATLGQACPLVRRFIWEELLHSSARDDFLLSPVRKAQIDAFSSAVRGWDRLEHLRCGQLDGKALSHLATLPALRHLTIAVGPPWQAKYNKELKLGARPFPALVNLELDATNHTFDSIIHFFSQFSRNCRLSVTRFRATATHASAKSVLDLCEALEARIFVDSLREVDFFEEEAPTDPSWVLDAEHLEPLGCFKYLESLVVETGRRVDVTNRAMMCAGMAWPFLHTTVINKDRGWRVEHPSVSLPGLRALLLTAPRLTNLAVAVETTRPMGILEQQRALRWINVAQQGPREPDIDLLDSKIEKKDMGRISFLLAVLFPHIGGDFDAGSEDGYGFRAWDADDNGQEPEFGGVSKPEAKRQRNRWRVVAGMMLEHQTALQWEIYEKVIRRYLAQGGANK